MQAALPRPSRFQIPSEVVNRAHLEQFKPFQCKEKCGAVVAQTDGAFVYVDGLIILAKTFVYTCLNCHAPGHWFPVVRQPTPLFYEDLRASLYPYPPLAQRYPALSPLLCPHCTQQLAYTDRARLYAGGLVLGHETAFKCLYCRKRGVWQPDLTPIAPCGWQCAPLAK